jgi:hypothetical protein
VSGPHPADLVEITSLEAAVRTGALTATLAAEAVLTRMGTTSPTTDGY